MKNMNGFTMIKEFLFKCDTCGAEVPSGIVNISGHWAKCVGKGLMDNVHKIDNSKLEVKDKMDLVKNLFNIHGGSA